MFKENSNSYPKIRIFKSLIFWHECRFCHMEFRREQGFKIIDLKKCREINEDSYYTSYCCCKCAGNIEELKEKLKNKNFLLHKPK